ncbi:MAG: polynucleotide kinase-phosphatase [Deltaproteobacteria bacterium]|jgi:protein phosphatase|nr:polynucleotide kinase-phosphatase [Deltaproteobacteria bacterium]
MRIEIPSFCLVALVGATGSGKSTFAARHFKPTEVLGSDFFRGLVADDENDQGASQDAFDCLYHVAGKRLAAGRLTVLDATNLKTEARARALRLAKDWHCLPVALVFDMPREICLERNRLRPDRQYPARVIDAQIRELKRSLGRLKREGFRVLRVFGAPGETEGLEIERVRLWNDKRTESGPFDVIGDIHGCHRELCALLERLGYAVRPDENRAWWPQAGDDGPGAAARRVIFLGDFCDRGPENVRTLRLAMDMVRTGQALAVLGNHDARLLRQLEGRQVRTDHGLDLTLAELAKEPPEFLAQARDFLAGLISHYCLDGGRLVVAHAGLKESMQGRASKAVRSFCLYGETTGETDEYGLPVRLDWAREYRGQALVAYGHCPTIVPQELNNTIGLDTGCVFGGRLTALRYPERELVQVAAAREHCAPAKPLGRRDGPDGDLLNVRDVMGLRRISPRLAPGIAIREEQAAAALETMSRFAADPRWLVYLPPTMSPGETSGLEDFLEHPAEVFGYFRHQGLSQVVCEEKHMGSRVVVVLTRDAQAAARRFGVTDGRRGLVYTRTGRPFFEAGERALEDELLGRLAATLEATGLWDQKATDWLVLDGELMPWSAKAMKLLETQYAATGTAGRRALAESGAALAQAVARMAGPAGEGDPDLAATLARFRDRQEDLDRFREAYRRYCWPVAGLKGYALAPFHLLATEGRVWSDVGHMAHLDIIDRFLGGEPLFRTTARLLVDLNDPASCSLATDWWLGLTAAGGEGLVAKPPSWIAQGPHGLVQPALKCRGREYLRLIYGPEYRRSLDRLKKRQPGRKRRLARQEFALGLEALERFVAREPLYRVHECVFAILALESEPMDPRL